MIKGIVVSSNLLDESKTSDTDSTHVNYMKSVPVTLTNGKTYTFSCNASCNGLYIRDASNDSNLVTGNSVSSISYTPNSDIQVYFRIWNNNGITGLQPMVNEGSSPLPYEPFGGPVDITRIAMKGKNLFDAATAYGSMYNDGVISDTTVNVSRRKNYFTAEQIGKQITISVYADKVTATRMYVRTSIDDRFVDSGSIYEGSTGTMSVTIIPQSVNDYWLITYGSGANGECILSKPMLNSGSQALPYEPYGMQQGWEVRDQQGTILWGADKTLTGTDSISFKGYALPLKSYEIEANMEQAASQAYTIEGTSSIDYQSDGTSISLQIVGNETQTGTPTPTVPIQPEECGERTGNAFTAQNVSATVGAVTVKNENGHITITGQTSVEISSSNSAWKNAFSFTLKAGTYYVSGSASGGVSSYVRKASDDSRVSLPNESFTLSEDTLCYIGFYMYQNTKNDFNIMINSGTTAAEFEPYGYKIPFSNGNTTYNVYLSEPLRKIGDYGDIVSSDGTVVRRIKKLVLTGTENWLISDGWKKTNTSVFYLNSADIIHISTDYVVFCMSESFEATTRNGLYNGDSDMISRTGTGAITIRISDTIATTDSGFKTWLSDKYSAGHPVEVWYVLANETTEQTTFPTVTPTQGANTLSVSTTLAPSKTRLTATSGVWPKNPIEPEEFGERTRNLLNESALTDGYHLSPQTGLPVENVRRFGLTQSIDVSGIGAITLSFDKVNSNSLQAMYSLLDGDTLKIRQTGCDSGVVIYPSYYGANKLYIAFYDSASSAGTVTTANVKNVMLNLGGTALPYEPYGKYKIPITNSGQTYNIFLNEPLRKIGTYADKVRSDGVVERKVKKLVFDGTELFQSGSATIYFSPYDTGTMLAQAPCTCSHYVYHDGGTSGAPDDSVYTKAGAGVSLWFKTEYGTDTSAFKTYLAQQYSAGHPVEVWYVLNTPTTESITAPEIATTQGANTLAIGTTLTPSKTTIIGHIKELT